VRRFVAFLLAQALIVSTSVASSLHVHEYVSHDHPDHRHGPAAHDHDHPATADRDHHSLAGEDHPAWQADPCEPGRHAVSVSMTCACIPQAHVDFAELPGPTIALGHSYPEAPTFGVPCPTAILTIGVLVGARGHVPLTLAIVPIVWGLIGGSAAVLLGVPTDYVLLGSGLLLTAILVVQGVQPDRVVR
jgi:hypothetical protein